MKWIEWVDLGSDESIPEDDLEGRFYGSFDTGSEVMQRKVVFLVRSTLGVRERPRTDVQWGSE